MNEDLKQLAEIALAKAREELIEQGTMTPAGTLIAQEEFMRDYERECVIFGDRHESELGPDEFCGRQKMYGDLSPENLG